jgi:uncharacterized protein (TIGR02284 family)
MHVPVVGISSGASPLEVLPSTSINLTERNIMINDEVISVLNDLIQTSKDGEQGFRSCAEDANERDAQFKVLFEESSRGCAAAASELQELVRALGGDPATHGSVSGSMHRQWLNIKSLITGKDDEAVLTECEREEDAALKSYREALQKDLSANIRMVVERQYQGVLANHDRVKSLRDQVHMKNTA